MSGLAKIIPFPGMPHAGLALQFRVELLLVVEPVWRRFVVPANYSFWDLHVAIQDVMGWEDRHLHEFKLDDPRTGAALRFGVPDPSGFHGADQLLVGWDHRIAEHFRIGTGPALYTYDFGDEWQHELHLEAIETGVNPVGLPRCVDGAGSCPDEDCGGPSAWEEHPAADLPRDEFDPGRVVFDNPHERWIRAFGHD